ncbi:MAG: hypothetical protein ABI305_01320 [Tepidiformaceae bacterium]
MTERMAERDDPFRNGEQAEAASAPSPVLPAEWERPIGSRAPDMRWESVAEDEGANEAVEPEAREPGSEDDAGERTKHDAPTIRADASDENPLSSDAEERIDDTLASQG